MIFFIAIGVFLVILAGYIKTGLDDACNGSGGGIGEIFEELYSTADSIWCESTNGCECYVDYTLDGSLAIRGSTYDTSNSADFYNVQDCSDYLESAFADYGVDFSDISEIVEYLDLFGDIESGYKCAGICNRMPVYYFGDTKDGEPEKACKSSIDKNLVQHTIQGAGIAYIVTGAFIVVIWFIQYGLCCRKDLNGKKANKGESKQF